MINENDNILFIGLGGAGQRHLRIFRDLLPRNQFYALRKKLKTPLLNSNFTINNSSNIADKYNIIEFRNEKLLKEIKPTLTVISCPTIFHEKYTKIAHSLKSNILVEKPGFATLKEFEKINSLFLNSSLCYFVSYQRLYNPLFIRLRTSIIKEEFGELIEGYIKVSSYVPDWHTYEDYSELYACKRELGGGVLLTECHEINMMCNIFGIPKNINIIPYFNKDFNLDIEDSIYLECIFKNAKINFDISFLRKPGNRTITLLFERAKVFLDLDNNILEIEKDGKKITYSSSASNDDMFINQAKDVISLNNNNELILNAQKSFSLIIDKLQKKI